MLRIVLNRLQKTEIGKLYYVIFPNLAHRCAVLNLPSYDTSLRIFFKIKNEFKRIKKGCGLAVRPIECQSKYTMRKSSKIKVLGFTIIAVFMCVKRQFKKFLNNSFFWLCSLQSKPAVESSICVNDRQGCFLILGFTLNSFLLIERKLL